MTIHGHCPGWSHMTSTVMFHTCSRTITGCTYRVLARGASGGGRSGAPLSTPSRGQLVEGLNRAAPLSPPVLAWLIRAIDSLSPSAVMTSSVDAARVVSCCAVVSGSFPRRCALTSRWLLPGRRRGGTAGGFTMGALSIAGGVGRSYAPACRSSTWRPY